VKVTGVMLCQIPKILLVHSTGQMEVRLIAALKNSCGRDVLKNILIKFYRFPSLLHLIPVQPSFCTGAF